MTDHPDPFDPDHTPPHFVDEDGDFAGWMSEADMAAADAQAAEAALAIWEAQGQIPPDHAIDLADLLAEKDATDDEGPDF
jgi:hypothetical protein